MASMSIIQDRVVVYSSHEVSYVHEGASRTLTAKEVEAEWLVDSGVGIHLPEWVLHGIETKGWNVEVNEGYHIVMDHDPAQDRWAQALSSLDGAPDFTPE